MANIDHRPNAREREREREKVNAWQNEPLVSPNYVIWAIPLAPRGIIKSVLFSSPFAAQ
jgi:hypothetical protein